MNGKSIVMLGLALMCGLGAMYGTSRMLAKDRNKAKVETQDVLVAARDLKVEEIVTPEMVKTVAMPRPVPVGSFSSFKDMTDRWVQIKMLAGEPIIEPKLGAKGSPAGLVARIPRGMRAYAIEVSESTGVSGFVLPDHRVDIVQSVAVNTGEPVAETILQDVLVLASGTVFTRPEDRSIQAHTVTLAVTPQQVDTLVAAKTRGPLTLVLRGVNDRTVTDLPRRLKPPVPPPIEVASVPPPPPPPPPPSLPAPLEILPAPKPVEAKREEPQAQFVTIYRGLNNSQRIRLNGKDEDDMAFPPPEK